MVSNGAKGMRLRVDANQTLGNASTPLDSNTNDDDFHTFRLATVGYGIFDIWRDGVLIGEDFDGGGASWPLTFGDVSSATTSDWQYHVDYVRWTGGAWSPTPLYLLGDANGDGGGFSGGLRQRAG